MDPSHTRFKINYCLGEKVPTDMTDNNVSNVYVLEDEVIAASETLYVHSLDKETGSAKDKVGRLDADQFSFFILKTMRLCRSIIPNTSLECF